MTSQREINLAVRKALGTLVIGGGLLTEVLPALDKLLAEPDVVDERSFFPSPVEDVQRYRLAAQFRTEDKTVKEFLNEAALKIEKLRAENNRMEKDNTKLEKRLRHFDPGLNSLDSQVIHGAV